MLLFEQEDIVSLKEEVFTDGTKIESAANRYTFGRGKNVKASKDRMKAQLDELWSYAQSVAAEELNDTAPLEYHEINPEKVIAWHEARGFVTAELGISQKVFLKLRKVQM